MFVRFRVGNFLSFKDIQEFSLIKGKPRNKAERVYEPKKPDKVKLLKFAAIFGANASGKSNLVSAMLFAQNQIIYGKKTKSDNMHYKLNAQYIAKPSYFEFEVFLDGVSYSYGFEIVLKDKKIVSEWLIELKPHGNNKVIFERDINNEDIDSRFNTELNLTGELKIKFDVFSGEIKNNAEILFLSEMNRAKKELYKEDSSISIINKLFRWFKESLRINFPDEIFSNFSYFHDVENKDEIIRVIKAFGTGITNFIEKPSSLEHLQKKIPERAYSRLLDRVEDAKDSLKSIVIRANLEYYYITLNNGKPEVISIAFNHGNEVEFGFSEESDGTRRILELVEIILSDSGNVFIIDEIDRCLHPQLTYKFISEFLRIAEKRNIQLIITTHESYLLDFNLLRQDEIWITDKNNNGETSLYSLDEFNIRFDKKVDKAYLDGRYGGVPIFRTIFPVSEG